MQDLAFEVGRLADALELWCHTQARREQQQHDERRKAEWGDTIRPFGIDTLLQAIPGLAAQFDRVVPPEFATPTDAGELTLACPCGKRPRIRAGRLVGCDCGRWFLHDGRDVHVALSPSPGLASEDRKVTSRAE